MGVTLTVELSEDLHRRVEARATRLGVTVSDVVREQLEEFAAGLDARGEKARRTRQQLNELGRRLGAEAERQGLTEEELVEAMDEDRRAVYEEMYGRLVRE